ncbi:cysteine--tRNA ligase [soil metagenome]
MPAPFKLFNTPSKSVELLQPLEAGKVSVYTCGPTVYGDPHIGNLRTYIAEDVLVRTLKMLGYQVNRAMNITDVGHLTSDGDDGEDKLEVGAKRDGTTAWEVAKKYEAVFLQDMEAFQLLPADQLIRATDTIPEQIQLVQQLEAKGFTYVIDDGVYYDSSKFPAYGDFAHLDIEGLQAGQRVELGDKRSVTDFALWKFSPKDSNRDMEWESPWGKGFPGWHIECSAIIRKALGDQIDIHCGGVDHIPVHHTNEIAQTTAVTEKPLANYWLHTEFLLVDGGKMSKSLGNLFTHADLEAKGIEPAAFKLFCYSASYRSKLNFSWEALEAAQQQLVKLRRAIQSDERPGRSTDISGYVEAFNQAMAQDLGTSGALAVLYSVLSADITPEARRDFATHVDTVLALNLLKQEAGKAITNEAADMVTARDAARAEKDWATSDALRSQLESLGYQVQDTLDGTHIF